MKVEDSYNWSLVGRVLSGSRDQ